MRINRLARRIIGLIQTFCLLLLVGLFFVPTTSANQNQGLGIIGFRESREIYDGVVFEKIISYNQQGEQRAHTVVIESGKLIPVATYGAYVYGGYNLTQMVELEEAKGSKVVVAINGDFYDTSNSIPLGAMIVNGRFVTSGNKTLVGFKADGTAVHGNASFTVRYNDGTKNTTINHVNKDRKNNTDSIYLYTEDYGTSTKSTIPGVEVVLQANGYLKVGGTVTATVKEVRTNATNTPINPGEMVIGVHANAASKISNLTVGTQITISVTDNTNLGWKDVVQAIGVGATLVEDGKIPESTAANKDVHPRTAIGFKEDGSYVLLQVDGRQPGYSNGVTYEEMYHFFVTEHNVKYAYNLDGGGSSQINVRLPGDAKATVQNSPSDGRERSNANGILFIAKEGADPNKELKHLHAYPRNLVILENGTVNINVKATDQNYYPVATPTNITYTVNGDIGTIDANGKFVAKAGAGSGTITIKSGNITETVTVTVVDSIDKMTSDLTFVSLSPGKQQQLNITAYKNHTPITAGNTAFTWSLSDSALGTISPDGLFTGTNGSATGYIIVKYKSFELRIPVEVGTPPKMITTFEDVIVRPSAGYNWDWTIENPQNGGTGSVSINTDERYVKFGYQSLRIDYDFRAATNTTGVSAFLKAGGNGQPGSTVNQYLKLEGYPTHIGMWVYGDGKGASIRMQLRDGNNKVQYIGFTPEIVDYVGWKYIEAEIPSGLTTPLGLQYAIRVMSVSGKSKAYGTLYFDNFRAVYGFRNDDVLSPKSSDPIPADGSTTANQNQTISLRVWDDQSGINTGINKNSIRMWINGEEVDNLVLVDNEDLSVTINYTPSALKPYRPGPQNIKVRFEDNYGNISFKEWSFVVEGDYVKITGTPSPNRDIIYSGELLTYTFSSNKFTGFEKLTGKVSFNTNAIEIQNVIYNDDITVEKNTIKAGEFEFAIKGMNDLPNRENPQLFQIIFKPKDGFTAGTDINLEFKDIKVYESGYSEARAVQIPRFEAKVDYKYRITYQTSTVGKTLIFRIVDDKLQPVEGVSINVSGASITVPEKSNSEGYIITDAFKHLPANTKLTLVAQKDGLNSAPAQIELLPSLGSSQPDFIVLTPGANASKQVVITWMTDIATTEGVVRYRVKGSSEWIISDNHETKVIVVRNANNQSQEYLSHRVELFGLQPNTEYEYNVGTEGNYSITYEFTTAKETGEIDILFLGDPQSANVSGYNITKTLIQDAFQKNPNISLGLVAGDLVEDVNMYSNWSALNTVLGSYFNSMIWASATGNHDVMSGYAEPFVWSFSGPRNGVDNVNGANYFFEYADIAVAVIDTETPDSFDAQKAWLIEKMSNTKATFKIVLMHRSVYPTFNNDTHIRDWYKIFDQVRIDVVLSGHDHIYNRTSMRGNQKVEVGAGAVYVSGGSAGPKFYNASNLDQRPWVDILYDDDHNIYSIININDKVLTFKAYALINGVSQVVDSFVIDRKTMVVPQSIEITAPEIVEVGTTANLTAVVYSSIGEVMDVEVSWEIIEGESGITIDQDGKLTIPSTADATRTVKVKAKYQDVFATVEITLYKKITLEEIVERILIKHREKINNILQ